MRRYGINKDGTVARLWYGKPVTELTELETAQFTVDTDIKLMKSCVKRKMQQTQLLTCLKRYLSAMEKKSCL